MIPSSVWGLYLLEDDDRQPRDETSANHQKKVPELSSVIGPRVQQDGRVARAEGVECAGGRGSESERGEGED